MKRTVVCLWTCGHTHTERIKCVTRDYEHLPRILKIGYRPHYVFFVFSHLDGDTAFYRQTNE